LAYRRCSRRQGTEEEDQRIRKSKKLLFKQKESQIMFRAKSHQMNSTGERLNKKTVFGHFRRTALTKEEIESPFSRERKSRHLHRSVYEK